MAIFIDTVSKISKNGIIYKNIDETLFRNLLGSSANMGKEQLKKKVNIIPTSCQYQISENITIEKLISAYKAYLCKIISHNEMCKIKEQYYCHYGKS